MDFKQLQSFVTLVEYKSFTTAADKLGLSQPTISTHLRLLEEELDTKLLLRNHKDLQITDQGQKIYDYALHLLEMKNRMEESCRENVRQTLHIGASTIPSSYVLPKLMQDFLTDHPDIFYDIHQSDSQVIIDGVLQGLYDVGLIGMKSRGPALECIPFCRDRLTLITPSSEKFRAMAQNDPSPIPKLLREPIILREKGSGSLKAADAFWDWAGTRVDDLNVIATINDTEAIKNLVSCGLGVSILSERAAASMASQGEILTFELPPEFSTRNLYYIYKKGQVFSSCVEEFLTFMEKVSSYDL